MTYLFYCSVMQSKNPTSTTIQYYWGIQINNRAHFVQLKHLTLNLLIIEVI